MQPTDNSNSESSSSGGGWINWYCSLEGHSFLAEVDDEFASDSFNYSGLKSVVSNFEYAVSMITGNAPSEGELKKAQFQDLFKKAKDLYGLLHARYIISLAGLQRMREKFAKSAFGFCPRVLCEKEKLLPVGLSDDLHAHRVRVYCQRCQEVYNVRDASRVLDGACIGTSFPHIFLQTYPELTCLRYPVPYVPKIFGFCIRDVQSILQIKMDKGEYGKSLILPRKKVGQVEAVEEMSSSEEEELNLENKRIL